MAKENASLNTAQNQTNRTDVIAIMKAWEEYDERITVIDGLQLLGAGATNYNFQGQYDEDGNTGTGGSVTAGSGLDDRHLSGLAGYVVANAIYAAANPSAGLALTSSLTSALTTDLTFNLTG